jgi:photosystem II stability/assembly factor-like uncharacterized protein
MSPPDWEGRTEHAKIGNSPRGSRYALPWFTRKLLAKFSRNMMRGILVICIAVAALLACTINAYSQSLWKVGNASTTGNILGVAFNTTGTGLCVGTAGLILRTTDAGLTWYPVSTGSSDVYAAVCFASDSIAILAAHGGPGDDSPQILRSTNAGLTWASVYKGSNYENFTAVRFRDAHTGIVAGDWSHYIFRTSDGGSTWRICDSGRTGSVHGLAPTDSGGFVAVGTSGSWGFVATSDTAATFFSPPARLSSAPLYAVGYSPASRATLIGGANGFLRMKRGVADTQQLSIGGADTIFAVWVGGGDTVHFAAVGAAGQIRVGTWLAGAVLTWKDWPSGTSVNLRGITSPDGKRLVAVGDSMTILYSDDDGWNWNRATILVQPHINAACTSLSGVVHAVGNQGFALFRNASNNRYAVTKPFPDVDLHAVVYAGGQEVVCGDRGFVSSTTDGGITWRSSSLDSTIDLYALDFTDSSHGVVAGTNGTVFITSDRGKHWNRSTTGIAATIRGAALIDATTAIVAGENGLLVRTHDAGVNWLQVGVASAVSIRTMANEGNTILLAGTSGFISRSSDGGVSWHVVGLHTDATVNAIIMHDSLVLLGCDRGELYCSFDTGKSFVPIERPMRRSIAALTFDNNWKNGIAFYDSTFISSGPITSSGWRAETYSPVAGTVQIIRCIDSLNTIAVAGNFSSMQSNDEGESWSLRTIGRTGNNCDLGYACSDSEFVSLRNEGSLLEGSTDAGRTWFSPNRDPRRIRAIAFHGTTGVMVGDQDLFAYSEDAGRSWVYNNISPSGLTWTAVCFDSLARIIRISSTWTVQRADDVRASWLPIGNAWSAPIILCPASIRILLAGGYRRISRSTNGGVTWSIADTLGDTSTATITAMGFPTPSIGLAVDDHGTVRRSTDAGITWRTVALPVKSSLGTICWYDARRIFIGANASFLISTDSGATWKWRLNPRIPLTDIAFTDSLHGYACGESGLVMRTTNGGRSWIESRLVAPGKVNRMAFLDNEHGIAVGDSGVYRTTDAGVTWKVSLTRPNTSYTAAFARPPMFYIGGDSGYIARSLDSGRTWTPLARPFTNGVTGITFTRNRIGVASNGTSACAITTDEGTTWSIRRLTQKNIGDVTSVGDSAIVAGLWANCAVPAGHASLRTDSLEIWRSTDGAATWVQVYRQHGRCFRVGTGVDGSVFIVAGSGLCLTSTNSGESWTEIGIPSTTSAVARIDSANGAATHVEGVISRFAMTRGLKSTRVSFDTLRFGAHRSSDPRIDSFRIYNMFHTNIVDSLIYCTDGSYDFTPKVLELKADDSATVTVHFKANPLTRSPAFAVWRDLYQATQDTIVLLGDVLLPKLTVAPSSISFGIVFGVRDRRDSVRVTNTGNDTVYIDTAWTDNGVFIAAPATARLAPGEHRYITVTFVPPDTSTGYSGSLWIRSNIGRLIEVPLSGAFITGVASSTFPTSTYVGVPFPDPIRAPMRRVQIPISSPEAARGTIRISGIDGRQLSLVPLELSSPGTSTIALDLPANVNGCLFITVRLGSTEFTRMCIVQ